MGRTEELREKFRRKALANMPDPHLVRFVETVDACIKPKGARILYTSNRWVVALHEQARGCPDHQLRDWIMERTADLFLSAQAPPRWVFEPTWCFHDDVPLTFVGQITDGREGELYLFRGTRTIGEGGESALTSFYKLILQHGHGSSDHDGLAGETITNGLISL